MKRTLWPYLLLGTGALALVALALYAYRGLPGRAFVADDFQWLLAVRGRSFGEVAREAFDAGAQSHFFRPVVWLLFWAEHRLFGLDPRGYHAVNLGLHLLNAALLGWLVWRLAGAAAAPGWRAAGALLAAGLVALHPAPFEAVAWISAQSELLAAALLLAMLHCWLPGALPFRRAAAILALGLALLTKESAVIGLPLLLLVDLAWGGRSLAAGWRAWLARYAAPLLLTLGYLLLQIGVERRNYLVAGGAYGFGPQLVLNPLRSLGLLLAPLPGTEHADTWWLPWVGAVAALALLVPLARGPRGARLLVLALALTLLPTAPFAAPPNSRYLYPPLLAAAALLGCALAVSAGRERRPWFSAARWPLAAALALALLWAGFGELAPREARYAAGAGPGASLWRLMQAECAGPRLNRAIIVEPPIAPPHAEAIVRLACGDRPRPVIVGRAGVGEALRGNSIVIGFPGGTATIEQRT